MRSQIAKLIAAFAMVAVAFVAGRISVSPPSRTAEGSPPDDSVQIRLSSKLAQVTSVDARRPTDATKYSWDDQWKALLAKPGSPSRDKHILAAIQELATREPQRAILLASGEPHARLRQEMLHAALSGWGQVAPDAAANWVFASDQTTLDKVDAVSSVLRSLVISNAEEAIRLTTRLLESHPDRAQQLGIAFISTLGANGNFTQAAAFAAAAKPDDQADWMSGAYSYWSEYQPENALAAANALTDPRAKVLALNAIISKWSYNNPKAVIDLAATFPPEQRALALTDALRNWAAEDPAEAAEWLNRADSSPELDTGVASVATSFHVTQKPDVALAWAESIVDGGLRSSTIAEVVRQWAIWDRPAARRYAESSKNIQTQEKAVLLSEL